VQLALTIPKQAGGPRQELHRDGELSLLDLSGAAQANPPPPPIIPLPPILPLTRSNLGTRPPGVSPACMHVWRGMWLLLMYPYMDICLYDATCGRMAPG
jgi:hypothetical protein